jgi:signal transduction histidine kinase
MALSEFILENVNEIVAEWEKFAKTIAGAAGMDGLALRDQAAEILKAIAHDMQRHQSAEEQETKSKGNALQLRGRATTAAESHSKERFEGGFNLDEMVSEYRALRATVIRMWTRTLKTMDGDTLYDLTRFNEGIDQALTESISRFMLLIEQARELFLGVLGHDLRTPIGVVLISAQFLVKDDTLASQQAQAASRILNSGTRIKQMVANLVDVAHVRLGGSLPIDAKPIDLSAACNQIIDEMRVLHPQRKFVLNVSGDLSATADAPRIAELLSNLMQNAVQHGGEDSPMSLLARGEDERVVLIAHNQGNPISESARQRIFEPLVRDARDRDSKISASLGLGLYIAREIALAHGGSIDVESSDAEGTSFIVSLPRTQDTG